MENIMQVNHRVSDSGYPVYHVQKTDASVCEVHIVVNCGSAHEEADSWGVAHFLEHLCFQGTPTKDKHQVSREQSLVGSYNAYTSQFNTVYHFNSLNEDFERGFELLKEAVFDSCFPEKEFEKEKSVIIEEWRMYDNYPEEHFSDYILEKCFGSVEGHPIIGTEESIRGMNPEKLHRFRNKWYGKNNIFIVVVGNLYFEDVMKVVDKSLPPILLLPQSQTSPVCLNNFFADQPKYTFETDRFEQAAFGMVHKWPSSKDIYNNRFIARFFSSALSKYMYEYIRDDLGLCYGVGISRFNHFDNANCIISMLTNNDYLEKAEIELNNLFDKIKSQGFPDEIFEIAKKRLTYSQVKTLDSVSGIANSLVNGVLGSSDEDWFLKEGYKGMDPAWLKSAAAQLTQDDLKQFANDWLNGFTKFAMVSTKK
jgi:predicted Zn-dependent peptidase